MPKRLGLRIAPTLKSFVLVSDKANIKRPATAKFNIEQVIKAEALGALIDGETDEMGAGAMLSSVAKMVSAETIESVARLLESEHRPITFDYAGKFGLAAFAAPKPADKLEGATNSSGAPKCPKCGNEMVNRRALKGTNAGNSFWGCSTYPKCRGVLNVE